MGAVVVLIGAPGAGKTKTGKRVARALGVPHLDTDRMIVNQHGPVADIFAEHGEAHFRELEREAVAAALGQDAVVSLGGGAVLDPSTRAALADYPVVQLTVSLPGILARLADAGPEVIRKRPLLRDGGIEAWTSLVAARQPLYDEVATTTIDTSNRPFDLVAEEVLEWLRTR